MPAPPSKKTAETPLAKAAAALEAELLEYEKFVAEVKRMNLNTEKSMHRAKDLLEHCAAGEQRMAERLQAFAAARFMRQAPIQLGERACDCLRIFSGLKRGCHGLLADRPGKHVVQSPNGLVSTGEPIAQLLLLPLQLGSES